MSKATLETLGDDRYKLNGIVDGDTAPSLLEQSAERFSSRAGAQLHVDLSGVSDSDSAGLALLIEWLRIARQRGQQMHFACLPPQIAALARISEVDGLVRDERQGAEVQPRANVPQS